MVVKETAGRGLGGAAEPLVAWLQPGRLELCHVGGWGGNGAPWPATAQTALPLAGPAGESSLWPYAPGTQIFFSQTELLLSSPHLTAQFSVLALFPHQALARPPVLLAQGVFLLPPPWSPRKGGRLATSLGGRDTEPCSLRFIQVFSSPPLSLT